MQHVEHDEATGTVAVHTPRSTCAFQVEDSKAVRHVHWGASGPGVGDPALLVVARRQQHRVLAR